MLEVAIPGQGVLKAENIVFETTFIGLFLGTSMIPGSWTGKKIIQRMSREKFLILVEVLLVISGVQMIFFS